MLGSDALQLGRGPDDRRTTVTLRPSSTDRMRHEPLTTVMIRITVACTVGAVPTLPDVPISTALKIAVTHTLVYTYTEAFRWKERQQPVTDI